MEIDIKPKIPVIKSDHLSEREPDTEDDFDFIPAAAKVDPDEEPDTEDESAFFNLPPAKGKAVIAAKKEEDAMDVEPDTDDEIPDWPVASIKGKEKEIIPPPPGLRTPPTSVGRSLHRSPSNQSNVRSRFPVLAGCD